MSGSLMCARVPACVLCVQLWGHPSMHVFYTLPQAIGSLPQAIGWGGGMCCMCVVVVLWPAPLPPSLRIHAFTIFTACFLRCLVPCPWVCPPCTHSCSGILSLARREWTLRQVLLCCLHKKVLFEIAYFYLSKHLCVLPQKEVIVPFSSFLPGFFLKRPLICCMPCPIRLSRVSFLSQQTASFQKSRIFQTS